MKKRIFLISVSLACFAVLWGLGSEGASQTDALAKREELYRLNNIGAAYMEQYKHEEAVSQFKKALAADADFAPARINLAMAYFFLNDSKAALEEARAAVKLAPASLHARYVLAATLRNEKQYDESIAEFNKVLEVDPGDPATNIQIGQIYSLRQKYAEAITAFRRALDAEPYNATAAYSLAQALIRSGNAPEGQKMLGTFQKLRTSGYATTLGNVYGEKGRYAEAVVSTGIEPDLQAPQAKIAYSGSKILPAIKSSAIGQLAGRRLTKADFTEATRKSLIDAFASNILAADIDADGHTDLFISGIDGDGKPFIRILKNDGGKLTEQTTGITVKAPVSGAVFGDYDNDSKPDVLLFGYRMLALWRNNGDGTFSEAKAGLPAEYPAWALSAAWVDIDHDGDLDIYLGNFADLEKFPEKESAVFPDDFAGQENILLRNNGNGTFTDNTAQAGLGGGRLKTTAVVATDFNNQRDIDLLAVNFAAPAQLFSNQRDGSFRESAKSTGLAASLASWGVAAGDLNKDNYVDFYLPNAAGGDLLFLSNGRGEYSRTEQPGNSVSAQMADLDNDGLLDVITIGGGKASLRRGAGDKLGEPVALSTDLKTGPARTFALADLDGDGGTEFLVYGEDGLASAQKPEGFGRNFSTIQLAGKTSNRSAVGTKVELRSGSLRQKLEVYASSPAPAAAGLSFGLGFRTGVDTMQLFWPAGILQSELAIKTGPANPIEELDRKGTSCPLLYAWDGEKYDFVTDFLGGSAIGYLTGPGQYNYPDTNEYIRVTGEQLKARDGLLSLRLNNQLEEVIYFDEVKLLAVDHPAETEVYPNERLMPAPPYPDFKIFTTREPRPPVSAIDDKGRNILPLLTDIDRRYPEDFEKLPYKGYAREHAIELDLGNLEDAGRVLLLMTAWIDYADSTSNLSASQAGAKLIPPYVQVRNERGEWQTVVPQMGFPAGLPKTMTVDLTGKFLCRDWKVRIVTSMRIYWDRILVDTFSEQVPQRITRLDPLKAELRWRGFPREYSPDGRKPLIYDYSTIEPSAPWKAHLGNYTRYGNVRELLLSADDMYVITRNGDEMQVDFDARRLPALPKGWKRTWLVYADGFGKDMDINSARPETIGELPFHGMKSYPYSKGDRYPITRKHLDYLERYNTRNVNEQLRAASQ
ncbi:MAG: FG-GAP-like repeat-containing protein [Blastocatellales bacterium]